MNFPTEEIKIFIYMNRKMGFGYKKESDNKLPYIDYKKVLNFIETKISPF